MKDLLTTQQIGKCGELLVQYKLLLNGIESAQMTTDSGIDLVAYTSHLKKALTIQVKTNLKPKPGGGKGKDALDWWLPKKSDAQFFALVELENQLIWIIPSEEVKKISQQCPPKGYHLFMVIDPSAKDRKDGKRFRMFEFEEYRLENMFHKIFC